MYLNKSNFIQILLQALVDTLQTQSSVRRVRQFQLYYVLSIGHTHQPGFQRVFSHPFSSKTDRSTNRQDLAFVRPPDAGKDFRLSIQINTVLFFFCFPSIPAQILELSATIARLCPCCGSMMQIYPVLNNSELF